MTKKLNRPDQPHYMQRVIEAALAARLKPGVHHVNVEHDSTCPMLNGGSECACVPDIVMRLPH